MVHDTIERTTVGMKEAATTLVGALGSTIRTPDSSANELLLAVINNQDVLKQLKKDQGFYEKEKLKKSWVFLQTCPQTSL